MLPLSQCSETLGHASRGTCPIPRYGYRNTNGVAKPAFGGSILLPLRCRHKSFSNFTSSRGSYCRLKLLRTRRPKHPLVSLLSLDSSTIFPLPCRACARTARLHAQRTYVRACEHVYLGAGWMVSEPWPGRCIGCGRRRRPALSPVYLPWRHNFSHHHKHCGCGGHLPMSTIATTLATSAPIQLSAWGSKRQDGTGATARYRGACRVAL